MTSAALIAGIASVLTLPIAWRIARGRFDPFEPIVLFALAYGVMFVARPIAMLVDDQRIFWGVDVRPELSRALLLALLGAVAFVAAYELGPARTLVERLPAPRELDTRVAMIGALAVAAVGLVALAVFLPLSDPTLSLRVLLGGRSDDLGVVLDATSTYIWYGSLLLAPAAFVLIALAMRARTASLIVAATVVVVLALVRVVPIGGRIVLLPLLGGIFALAYLMRDRRPGLPLLAAIMAVTVVGSYFTLHVRDPNDSRTLRTAIEDLGERPHAVFDPVLHGADAEMVLALSGALSVIPEPLGHRWGGATVGNLLVRPVPRELWPSKPRPPGETVVATVWPDVYPGLDPAFSPLLVLYWDFGLAGVAVGMAVFGLLARLLYAWFLRNRQVPSAQLVFATATWFVVIAARNDPVDTIVMATFVLAPVLGIVAVASTATSPHTTRKQPALTMLAEQSPATNRRP